MGSSSLCCRPFKAGSKSGVKTVLLCLRQARVSSVRVAAFLDEDHPRTSANPRKKKVADKLSISEQVGAETVTVTTRARPPSIARDDAIERPDLSSSNGHSSCSDTDGYLADSEDSTPSINNASSSSSASSNIDFSESSQFPTAHQSSRTRAALRPGPLGRFAYPPSSVRTQQAPLTLEMLPDLNKE